MLLALVVPKAVEPANNAIRLLASAVPSNVGVLSFVTLSLLDEPLSELANKSGVLGALGASVSIVILKPELATAVHALTMHTYTESEWIEKHGEVPQSPPCHGGSGEETG